MSKSLGLKMTGSILTFAVVAGGVLSQFQKDNEEAFSWKGANVFPGCVTARDESGFLQQNIYVLYSDSTMFVGGMPYSGNEVDSRIEDEAWLKVIKTVYGVDVFVKDIEGNWQETGTILTLMGSSSGNLGLNGPDGLDWEVVLEEGGYLYVKSVGGKCMLPGNF